MAIDLSIIIPAYNAEATIARCVQSCIGHGNPNTEVIVVNDGSVDGTLSVLEKFPRIKSLTINNSGPSHARNVGLDVASGKYIAFCDADDWLEMDSLASVVALMDEDKVDIAILGYRNVRHQRTNVHQFYKRISMDTSRFMGALLLDSRVAGFLCNKVYRRSVIGNIRLNEEISIYEDIDFNLRIASEAARLRVSAVPGVRYNYDLREQSLTRTDRPCHSIQCALRSFLEYGDERFTKDVRAGMYSAALKNWCLGENPAWDTENIVHFRDYWLNNHCPIGEKIKMLARVLGAPMRGWVHGVK